MVEAYGYKQQIINELNSIDNDTNNFYNFKGLNFLSRLSSKNENIVITFHGAVVWPKNSIDRIIFRGYDWKIPNTDIICISDFMLNKYYGYIINWYLSTEKYNVDELYKTLLDYLLKNKKYKKKIFTGTSAGGYPSIKYALYFNSVAIVSNSQLYLEEYYARNKPWKGGIYHTYKLMNDNDDKIIYKPRNIEEICKKYNPQKVIIYQNIDDIQHYDLHFIPFKKFITENCNENLFEFIEFKYIDSDNHHSIIFPDNTKHIDILQEIIENN